ncbi:replicative helicase loader/inhibitor [Acetobacterium tundrae]|uniref:Uncharacterized protein n=1 Tax=Acetobacterium tundrae TaxID=132932 RepID=A0ABR6WJM1_9FIRM|nr:replicative helicase loader/inhibitor [Acetobacterium tundrae]MBC3796451.1 hypothetical protein [Acetobacterium tundrae]
MNLNETNRFLLEMQGVYPRINVRDATIQTWQEILENPSYETCHKAYIKYLKSGEAREPKPGDILSISLSMYKAIVINEVECEICHGRGMLMLIDKNGHESVGRCTCENGKKYPVFPIVKLDFYHFNDMGRVEVMNA